MSKIVNNILDKKNSVHCRYVSFFPVRLNGALERVVSNVHDDVSMVTLQKLSECFDISNIIPIYGAQRIFGYL